MADTTNSELSENTETNEEVPTSSEESDTKKEGNIVDFPQKKEDVADLDMSAIRKKRFRIDGDDSRILELNTSDVNIVTRMSEVQPKIEEIEQSVADLQKSASEVNVTDDDTLADSTKKMKVIAKKLKESDKKMRELLDYIFDAPVSETISPYGSMYDPINGQLRYEHILVTLLELYEDNLRRETRQISLHAQEYTKKYTKK